MSTPRVTFTIKDRVCDEVQDLAKMAKRTTELWILVLAESPDFGPSISLSLNENGNRISYYALTRAGELRLFNKLAPIFKRRNLRLRTLVWSHYWSFVTGLFGAVLATLSLVLVFVLKPSLVHHPIRDIVSTLLLVSIIITLWATLSYHSVIIMRPSSEPSALRRELLQKFPLLAISNILTFLLTLLGFYLKHKYWP